MPSQIVDNPVPAQFALVVALLLLVAKLVGYARRGRRGCSELRVVVGVHVPGDVRLCLRWSEKSRAQSSRARLSIPPPTRVYIVLSGGKDGADRRQDGKQMEWESITASADYIYRRVNLLFSTLSGVRQSAEARDGELYEPRPSFHIG